MKRFEPLQAVCNAIFTGLPPRLKDGADSGAKAIPLVGIRALTPDGYIDFKSLEQFRMAGRPESRERLLENDVLLSIRGSLPKTAFVQQAFPEDTYASGNLVVLRPNQSRLDATYLWSFLARICREERHPLLTRASTQQLSIRIKDLCRLEIPLPPLHEQQAIGQTAVAVRDAVLAQREALSKGEKTFKAFLSDTFQAYE